ncbi:hypothetical protein RYH80_04175 [Halobaculum sp. MBLA0147]|uniref:hypothetical protein n=1 Tax=Halobaculum sp. MBLA0147 TaxID=3079934 RepID=UPI0035245C2E
MCSNDSPSQKRDGTTSERPSRPAPAALRADYADSVATVRDTPLPVTRTDALAAQCGTIQDALDTEGRASNEAILTLIGVVAEAVADVASARVVRDDAALPTERPAAAGGTPEYTLTVAEREACLDALADLLFTAVDTPTRESDVTADAQTD